jgi:hypothetical protein
LQRVFDLVGRSYGRLQRLLVAILGHIRSVAERLECADVRTLVNGATSEV